MPLPEGFSDLTPSQQLEYAGRKMARAAGVDPELVSSIGNLESRWNPAVRDGTSGEIGPLQIMPATAQGLGVDPDTLRDPVTNLQTGITLLSQLSAKYQGDPAKIAAAYNGGEGAVDAGAIPEHSQWYARTVLAAMPAATEAPPTPSASRMPLMSDAQSPVESRVQAQMPPITTPLAGEGDARMPLVTQAMAGERVPPRPGSIEELLPATSADWAARMTPEGFANMDVAAPFLAPPTATFRGAAGLGALYNSFDRLTKIARTKTPGQLTADDYKDVGNAALWGAAGGVAMHAVGRVLFGAPAPERRAAEEALTVPGQGVFGAPSPPPVPVDQPSRAALGQRVEDIATGQIPQVEHPQVTAAYNDFRATTRGRPIDVTDYNRVLNRFEQTEFPDARQAAPERLFTPVGTPVRVTIPGQGTQIRWDATADQVLASENGIARAARDRAYPGAPPTIDGGLMLKMRGQLGRALGSALTGDESTALQGARDLALREVQARNALDYLRSARAGGAGNVTPDLSQPLNPTALQHALEANPAASIGELGQSLYDQLLTLARAGNVLAKQPHGQEITAQLAARALGALGGYLGGDPYGHGIGVSGAVTGFLVGPRLFGAHPMAILEHLARSRGTAGAIPEAVGRLAVSFAMDRHLAPDLLGRAMAPSATPQRPSLPIDQPSPRATPPPVDQPGAASQMAGY